MEKKILSGTNQRPQEHIVNANLVKIDLPAFITQLKQESTWKESDRNAITVFKTNGLRVVLIALQKNAEMIEHTTDGHISVQVLAGNLQFSTPAEKVIIPAGQMIALQKQIPHTVLALEETVFLLTLTTSEP